MTFPATELHALLAPFGFERQGRTWRRRRDDTCVVVDLQKDSFGNRWFLNIGVWLNALGECQRPLENQCHVQFRAERLQTSRPNIADALDLSGREPFADIDRPSVLAAAVPAIIEFADTAATLDGVLDWIDRRPVANALVMVDAAELSRKRNSSRG